MANFFKKPESVLRKLDIMESNLLGMVSNVRLYGFRVKNHSDFINIKKNYQFFEGNLKKIESAPTNPTKENFLIKETLKSIKELISEIEKGCDTSFFKKEEAPMMQYYIPSIPETKFIYLN